MFADNPGCLGLNPAEHGHHTPFFSHVSVFLSTPSFHARAPVVQRLSCPVSARWWPLTRLSVCSSSQHPFPPSETLLESSWFLGASESLLFSSSPWLFFSSAVILSSQSVLQKKDRLGPSLDTDFLFSSLQPSSLSRMCGLDSFGYLLSWNILI